MKDKIHIEDAEIKWSWKKQRPTFIALRVTSINFAGWSEKGDKESEKSFLLDKETRKLVKENCEMFNQMALQLEAQEIKLGKDKSWVSLNLLKESDSDEILLSSKGTLDGQVQVSVSCAGSDLALVFKKINFNKLGFLKTKPFQLAEVVIKKAEFAIDKENVWQVKIPFKTSGKAEEYRFLLLGSALVMSGKDSSISEAQLQIDEVVVRGAGKTLTLVKGSISGEPQRKNLLNWDGVVQVSNLVYEDEKLKKIGPLKVSGLWNLRGADFQKIQFKIFDLKNQKLLPQIELQLSEKKKILQIKDKDKAVNLEGVVKSVPRISNLITKVSGQVEFPKLRYDFSKTLAVGESQVVAQNVSGKSENFTFKNVDIRQELSIDKEVGGSGVISAKRLTVGPQFENVDLNYRLLNLDKVKVNLLSFWLDGANVFGKNFIVEVESKKIGKGSWEVKNLELQKALRFFLGEELTAEGSLKGKFELETFKNWRPVIEDGVLTATGKGWIKYRPEGFVPDGKKSFSTGPMDILKNYLYDFTYESLQLEFSSDKNLDMRMTLRALGRNPSYLNGKPLKLNVNIEQNLLAPIRSVLLTYRLPEKIEKELERIGSGQ